MTNRSLSFLAVMVVLLLAACAAPAPSPQAERTERPLVTVYRSPT